MHCTVYKSLKKPDTYLYVATKEETGYPSVILPEVLDASLSPLESVLQLELTPERQLARVSGGEVIKAIQQQGWYLQMPEKLYKEPLEIL